MFTLKLYRASPFGGLVTRVVAVHHVQTQELGEERHTLAITAFHHAEPSAYDSYTVGERLPDTVRPNVTIGGYDDDHWEWGLLENWEGNTSQHFRPHSYGLVPAPRKAA